MQGYRHGYSNCDEYTVFDLTNVSNYTWDNNEYNTTYIVANNIDYTIATHAVDLHYKNYVKGGYYKVASKKKLILSEEQIAFIKEKVNEYKNKTRALVN